MSERFKGKTVLITGGTSGIGLATAKRIVAEGGDVAVTGTTQENLDAAGRALPSSALVLRNDSSSLEDIAELEEKIAEMGKGLDGLFLNAGYGKFRPVEKVDAEFFDHMNNVNVRGPMLQMAALKKHLNEGAGVLLTSSVAPFLGGPEAAVYAATKSSLATFTRSFARDLAPEKIRVNAIGPGPISTGFFGDVTPEEEKELKAHHSKMVPLGRFGESEEVAAVACFLLSEEASYVTGSEYMVDGGMTLR
ncbi:SDR family oxidoreductase [Litorimonas sp. WD9-15]|uniref:SDR family oxidoreductase n=1 Tax=Litorimonas sp. WD9-15 TaxID=3418716 RepID=UPI003D08703C